MFSIKFMNSNNIIILEEKKVNSSALDISSFLLPEIKSKQKEEAIKTELDKTKTPNYDIVICDSITIGNMNLSKATSVRSQYLSNNSENNDRFSWHLTDMSNIEETEFSSKDCDNSEKSLNQIRKGSLKVKKTYEKEKEIPKRRSTFAPVRAPTPHFPHISTKELHKSNFFKEKEDKVEITPKTTASDESRNSRKMIISDDSPAYRIITNKSNCKIFRKYKFNISEKVKNQVNFFLIY